MPISEAIEDVIGDLVHSQDELLQLTQEGALTPEDQGQALELLRSLSSRLGKFLGKLGTKIPMKGCA